MTAKSWEVRVTFPLLLLLSVMTHPHGAKNEWDPLFFFKKKSSSSYREDEREGEIVLYNKACLDNSDFFNLSIESSCLLR